MTILFEARFYISNLLQLNRKLYGYTFYSHFSSLASLSVASKQIWLYFLKPNSTKTKFAECKRHEKNSETVSTISLHNFKNRLYFICFN